MANDRQGCGMMQYFTGQPQEWDKLIVGLPNSHLLQTSEWAQFKSAFGWEAIPIIWQAPSVSGSSSQGKIDAAVMILKKTVPPFWFPWKMNILYSPKGPLMDWGDKRIRGRVLDDLQEFARQQRGIFIKIDPDVVLGRGIPGDEQSVEDENGQAFVDDLTRRGWRFSHDQIQFRNTVMLDLSSSEERILAQMKQKTRYNIRLAQKKGVVIRTGVIDDLPILYRMYAETSVRDGFVIRNENYFRSVWSKFMSTEQPGILPHAEPLIAEVDGDPVAALFIFYFAGRAYYLYGMSREAHRDKMPNHLLQWEAMRRAKAVGCWAYDLWGAPDEFIESDSMWGVFRFKEGLGGEVVRTLGAWDYTSNPSMYKLYTEVMPGVLSMMRNQGKRSTKQLIDS
jgi:lipid II:glycine glycyltransferase (peptidoglycan interpeptide bridge formation enzyme)